MTKQKLQVYFTTNNAFIESAPENVIKDPCVLISYFGIHQNRWPPTVRRWKTILKARPKYEK